MTAEGGTGLTGSRMQTDSVCFLNFAPCHSLTFWFCKKKRKKLFWSLFVCFSCTFVVSVHLYEVCTVCFCCCLSVLFLFSEKLNLIKKEITQSGVSA